VKLGVAATATISFSNVVLQPFILASSGSQQLPTTPVIRLSISFKIPAAALGKVSGRTSLQQHTNLPWVVQYSDPSVQAISRSNAGIVLKSASLMTGKNILSSLPPTHSRSSSAATSVQMAMAAACIQQQMQARRCAAYVQREPRALGSTSSPLAQSARTWAPKASHLRQGRQVAPSVLQPRLLMQIRPAAVSTDSPGIDFGIGVRHTSISGCLLSGCLCLTDLCSRHTNAGCETNSYLVSGTTCTACGVGSTSALGSTNCSECCAVGG